MKRKVIIDKEFKKIQNNLSNMSTFEIKRKLSQIAPELSEDIKNFKTHGVNYSEYANNEYKKRTIYALVGELLKRDANNRKKVRSFSYSTGFYAIITAISIFFTIGYLNRGEKNKAVVSSDGIVTYSNGMKYSDFSNSDLLNIFDYSENKENNGYVFEFISDCISGYDNMILSSYTKDIFYEKALEDAEMLLKYLEYIKLNGITKSTFYMENISIDQFKKLDLSISDDIQSLCKVHMLAEVINKYNPEIVENFYKSIYHVKDGNKIYFNTKKELINFVGFEKEEDYNKFIMEVVYTLYGNVFYCSNPTTSEFNDALYDNEILLTKTL